MSDLFFLIVGIILTLLGASSIIAPIINRANCSERVIATVVTVKKKKSGYWRGHTFYQYFPTFSYTVDGKEYTTTYDMPVKSSKNYRKNDMVTIKCNPKRPENICVGMEISPYLFGLAFCAMGIFLVICYFL